MESKIEATDRLRREGRWSEASRRRDDDRENFLQEGIGRREANNKAWRAMIEAYPPLSDEQIDWYAANLFMVYAEFPPDFLGAENNVDPDFAAFWWMFWFSVARLARLTKDDTDGAEAVLDAMLDHGFEGVDRMCEMATCEPFYFVQVYAANRFRKRMEAIEKAENLSPVYAGEIERTLVFIESIVDESA